jgi:quinol monooxygenase YgiN
MVLEIVEIDVKPGQEKDFEAAVAEAAEHFKKAEGCRSLELLRVVERPSSYRLVVGWGTIDDHMVTFRNSSGFQEWRKLAGPYFAFATPPRVEHASTVLKAF